MKIPVKIEIGLLIDQSNNPLLGFGTFMKGDERNALVGRADVYSVMVQRVKS